MELFEYQKKAIDRLRESIAKGNRKIILSIPTGGGKTVIATAIMDMSVAKGKKVLFCVNQNELIEQTVDKFKCIKKVSILRGKNEHFDEDKPIQIATLQTLIRRLDKHDLSPDLIIIDEIHWGYSGGMMKKIIEAYPKAIVIGLSATPITQNGKRLREIDEVITVVTVNELINMGRLVDVECYADVRHDLTSLKIVNGDFDEKSLEELMCIEKTNKEIVNTWVKRANGLKTIVFGVSIAHCEKLRDEFVKRGYICEIVSSNTPKIERERLLSEFKNGKIQILVNVAILTTGFDDPTIECILLARPTKALRLYIQIVGRGLRIAPNKSHCLILDCANNIKMHDYPTIDRDFSEIEDKKGNGTAPNQFFECECGYTETYKKLGWSRFEAFNNSIKRHKSCPKCGAFIKDEELKQVSKETIVKVEKPIDVAIITIDDIEKDARLLYKLLNRIREIKGYKQGWFYYQQQKITQQKSQIIATIKNTGKKPIEVVADFCLGRNVRNIEIEEVTNEKAY